MAAMTKPLKLTPILFFFFFFSLALLLHSTSSQQFSDDEIDGDDEVEEYVFDGPVDRSLLGGSTTSVFLKKEIKKGTRGNLKRNVCNGVYANNWTSFLNCCKRHCRNIHGNRNNCGECGKKCRLGQLCCNSKCTSVAYNANHCGKCNKKCAKGLKCVYMVLVGMLKI